MGEKWRNETLIGALNATGGLIYRAAQLLQCSPETIYKRAARVPSVRAAIDTARGKLVDDAEGALHNAILKGEGWAIALALKTLGKGRGYVEKTELDVTSKGKPIEFIEVGTSEPSGE
jgi:hypothetical protein